MKALASVDFQVPVRTVSEMNDRCHWAVRLRRKKEQREAVAVAWQNNLRGKKIQLPCVVKLTRIGPKSLDGDNWQSGAKFIRDIIAQKLGVDDGSDQVRWEYEQMPVGIREYAVKISIQSLTNSHGD